jgi:hypothetical protein
MPREQRDEFRFVRTMGGDWVQAAGVRLGVVGVDLHHLVDVGLLRITNHHSRGSGFNFYVPPEALEYYAEMKREVEEPMQQVEANLHQHLDAAEFRARYPDAYARWRKAADLLWGADSERELSTIGHKCREAVQEFATILVERDQLPEVNPDKTKTRDRLGAVLRHHRPSLGEKRGELLDALFGYWRAAGDLIQRQEHEAQKEGEALVWEDGRRVVFQTAVLMFEVDRALGSGR